ncbi:MFS-type transporter SLC18B1-like [Amblyomma americanum]
MFPNGCSRTDISPQRNEQPLTIQENIAERTKSDAANPSPAMFSNGCSRTDICPQQNEQPLTIQENTAERTKSDASVEAIRPEHAADHLDPAHQKVRCISLSNAGGVADSTRQRTKDVGSGGCTRSRVVLVLLALGNFCVGASVSMQAPFFPHEAERKGITSTEYGFVFSVFELTIFFVAPIFAKIVPIVKPRFMLISGLLYVGMASILFGFLNKCPPGATFLGLAIAIRVIEGVGTAGFQTAVFSIVAAEFPTSLATSYSIQQTVFGAGLVAGPSVGGCLYQVGGFVLPFVSIGSLMLVCNALVYLLLPATEDSDESGQRTGNMIKFWCNPGILLDAYCVFCTFVIIGYNAAILEPHLRQFSLEPYLVGLVFVLNGTVYACTAWIWGKIADKTVRTKELGILGCILLCCCLVLIGPAPFIPLPTAIWSVMLALALFGLGSGGTIVSSFVGSFRDTLKRGFPDDLSTYGLVSSVFTVSHSMGAFVGPTLGGYLLEVIGYRMGTMVLLGNELLLICALCIYVTVHRKTPEDLEPLLKEAT